MSFADILDVTGPTLAQLVPAATLVRGNRMSSLPVAEFCSKSPQLGAKHGSGRAAAMSSVFHARCAGQPDPTALTPEEKATIERWHTPGSTTLADGTRLMYSEAEKEVEVYLDAEGRACSKEAAVSVGHLDFRWVAPVGDMKIVYVTDMKKTQWTASGPDSLQLLAYAHASCEELKADGYATGLFILETGEWIWSSEVVMFDSDEYEATRRRIAAAITNTSGQAATGPHCRDCWDRLRCEEHVLPAAAARTYLAPLAEGAVELDPETAGKLMLAISAVEDVVEKAKENLKEYCRRTGQLTANGRRLGLTSVKGRETVDIKALREGLGEEAEKYVKRGESYQQWGRWSGKAAR